MQRQRRCNLLEWSDGLFFRPQCQQLSFTVWGSDVCEERLKRWHDKSLLTKRCDS